MRLNTKVFASRAIAIQNASRVNSRPAFGSSLASLAIVLVGVTATEPAVAQTAPNSPAAAAPATDQNAGGIQDIIVTAEKRSTSLQRTPISVTALTGDAVRERQIKDLRDIQSSVANFKMGDAEGIAQITIRGVGSSVFKPGSEGEVAVNENEVYIARGIAQQTGLFDVSSLEVLRGPQGTLYGRNATAGAVNIATARPGSRLAGYGDATAGNYGELRFEGAIGGPIDKDGVLGIRIAGFRERRNGYGANVVTGNDVDDRDAYGVRGTAVLKPLDGFQATAIVEYYHQQDHNGQFHYFGQGGTSGLIGASGLQPLFQVSGGYAPSNPYDVALPFDGQFGLKTLALTGILDWNNGGPFSVHSVTGYRRQNAALTFALDPGSSANARGFYNEPAHQFSQELQLHYDTSNLHVTAGGYYFREKDNVSPLFFAFSSYLLQNVLHLTPVAPFTRYLVQSALFQTDAYAGFGQATFNLTPELSLTAGIRYSSETKKAANGYGVQVSTPYPTSAPFPSFVALPDATFSAWTPKFGIQYQVTPRTLFYASYAKGFKSGGFDVGVAKPQPYRPEKLTSYEAGMKTTLAGGHVRANVSGFYYDYSDLQVQQVVGAAVQTSNAATARVYGIEGEFNFLLGRGFEVDASGSWTHARYQHYCGADPARPAIVTPASCAVNGVVPNHVADFSGNSLSNSPDWRANLAAQYTYDIANGRSLILRSELEYSDRYYFAPDNLNFISQPSYVKLDLYLTYRLNEHLQVRGFMKNVGGKITKTSSLIASTLVGNPIVGSLAPPRTFGGQISFKL